jgi:transposase
MPTPRKYPDELRERGVRPVFESGRPIAHVARDLGVHRETCGFGFVRPRPTMAVAAIA